jgi:hypothetical protein
MLRRATAVAILLLLVGCASQSPSLPASPSATATPQPTPTATPSPTPKPPITFPLAVVTGLTNLKATVTLDELGTLAGDGTLLVPCGVTVDQPQLNATAPCVAADQIVAELRTHQEEVALLPPGLVEPAAKVLPIAGDGPFGLFGPDLFGDPEARALPYPVTGHAPAEGPAALDPAWTAYDASQVWTLASVGSLCSDRNGAYQAVTLRKGWDWIFTGGTAKYKGKPYNNPYPPAGVSVFPIVAPVETGNDGATAEITKRADVALADHKCPIVPNSTWSPSLNGPPSLSVPETVVPRWQSFLGIDAVFLAADHQSDRGVTGIRSSLQILDKYKIPHTGLGMDLDQALEPAYVETHGLKIAFVSWNNVAGPIHAAAGTPGVAWLTKANVDASVQRARDGGADLIICDPQWWHEYPDPEYHPDLGTAQQQAVGWMKAAGCDQILAGGLHIAGGTFFDQGPTGPRVLNAGPGNYQYGQNWWQQTQEGVIPDMTFVGTRLVNFRLHPYVMINAARPALTDPEGDGHYVLDRIWKSSELGY